MNWQIKMLLEVLYYIGKIWPSGQSLATWPSGYPVVSGNVKGERLEIFYHIGA